VGPWLERVEQLAQRGPQAWGTSSVAGVPRLHRAVIHEPRRAPTAAPDGLRGMTQAPLHLLDGRA